METFQECLKSVNSCDKVIEEMQKVSKIDIDKNFDEGQFNNMFFKFCKDNFFDKYISLLEKNGNHLDICNDNIFILSHHILSYKNKIAEAENICYKQLELLYQTFFFYEFNINNETNNFTFYNQFPENLVEQNEYETYLLNIGKAILDLNYKNYIIQILFSEETPLFLRNIILVCFLYIRNTSKNADDFISFCVPCLNHSNLYYLCEKIKQDLHYKFTELSEINYYLLEKFLIQPNCNIINEDEQTNFFDVKYQINDKEISKYNKEELSIYFCFPNKNEKENDISSFFTSDNLNKNKNKFLKLTTFNNNKNNSDIAYGYKINYDNPQINDKIINAFSFMFLLKNKKINTIDNHFFQIYNYSNIKINSFTNLLEKYVDSINKLLDNSITYENKNNLFKNSGFYKLDNEYVLLISINEEDEKVFYLKLNLGTDKITSMNQNEDYKVYQVNISNFSSFKTNTESNEVYAGDIVEDALYNFGNYSFEKDLRTYLREFFKGKTDIIELPRLYFLLNYAIPISKDSYYFITNVKSKMKKNCSYGYAELDFVLKNGANEDIIINSTFLPYKEKILLPFQKKEKSNGDKIIFKKNSIIFFEFKVSFPQFTWKNKFIHLLKKIKKFLKIYKMRGLYNNEYIQIYFICDNFPDIYFIEDIKKYLNKNSDFGVNFEFGIYYFTRGISLINSITLENNVKDNMKNMMRDILETFDLIKEKGIEEKINELKTKYKLNDNK